MQPLLYICHRTPYPPNKGDKITTFNLLKYLADRYKLYVAYFIDDRFDFQYIKNINHYCEDSFYVDICGRSQLVSGVKSLLLNRPVSIAHYQSDALKKWVETTINQHQIEHIFVYCAAIGQFFDNIDLSNKKSMIHMADIDSDKWRQYAENKPWYSRWIYEREYRLLAGYEQKMLAKYDACAFITDDEANLFKQLSPPELAEKIMTVKNGVDTEYFDPEAEFDYTDKPSTAHKLICFTGAMDYWANENAVVWFCEQVWPKIQPHLPELKFYIVGSKPTEKVKSLANIDGVHVTGRVVDVRPYLHQSICAVAPLQIARGVQNKVLEAMSMALPVVMTSMAQEGIELPKEQLPLVIDEPNQFAAAVRQLVKDKNDFLSSKNRQWIIDKFGWGNALSPIDTVLD